MHRLFVEHSPAIEGYVAQKLLAPVKQLADALLHTAQELMHAVRGAANSQVAQCREVRDAARDRAAQLMGVKVPARVVVGARSAPGRELTVASLP